MGNQSRQTEQDNRQQAMGGEQPTRRDKELGGGKSRVSHSSGDRNANEDMRDEGFEQSPKR